MMFFLPLEASAAAHTSTFNEALDVMGLVVSIGTSFTIDKSYVRGDWDGERRAYWTLLASSSTARLRVEAVKNVSRKEAERRMRERFVSVEMLYFGDAAYPGMVTKRFEIPDDLKPEVLSEGPGGYKTMILHATRRMTYGVGARDLVAYRSLMSYRYCPKVRVLAQIEIFFTIGSFDRKTALEELAGFSCL